MDARQSHLSFLRHKTNHYHLHHHCLLDRSLICLCCCRLQFWIRGNKMHYCYHSPASLRNIDLSQRAFPRAAFINYTCGWQCDCCCGPSRGISQGAVQSEMRQCCGCSWDTHTLCFSTGCTLAQKCLLQAGPLFLQRAQWSYRWDDQSKILTQSYSLALEDYL